MIKIRSLMVADFLYNFAEWKKVSSQTEIFLHHFVRIKDIANALEMFAPLPLQDGFDNAGLQIGLTEAEVTGGGIVS